MIDEPKKYTEKQLLFLDALMGEAGGNIRKAMDIAGYAKTTKSGEVVKNLREEVIERASLMLAMKRPLVLLGFLMTLVLWAQEIRSLLPVRY